MDKLQQLEDENRRLLKVIENFEKLIDKSGGVFGLKNYGMVTWNWLKGHGELRNYEIWEIETYG